MILHNLSLLSVSSDLEANDMPFGRIELVSKHNIIYVVMKHKFQIKLEFDLKLMDAISIEDLFDLLNKLIEQKTDV